MNKIIRCCSWSLILYEDSTTILNVLFEKNDLWSNFALSPLHNLDVNDKGELKEPHYHLLITFREWKSLNTIKSIFNFKSNIFGERLYDRWSAYEYLTHLNDTDKAVYNENDIVCSDKKYYTKSSSKDIEIEKNHNIMQMIDNIIDKVPYREMVELYGRDYVLNYERYLMMARLVNLQEKRDTNDLMTQRTDINYVKNS